MYHSIYEEVFQNRNNVFLSGIAGTGKSYNIKLIKDYCDMNDIVCNITSLTGASAILLKGTTIHRFSGIGLGNNSLEKTINNICTKNKSAVKRWKKCEILIIDEISMMGKKIFELLNDVSKNIRDNDSIFGGIQLIISGDFNQLPPINDEYCFKSDIWELCNFKIISMKIPYRFKDTSYFEMLCRARFGKLNEDDVKKLEERVEKYNWYKKNPEEGRVEPTIIFSLKNDVNFFNVKKLEELDSELFVYECLDTFEAKRRGITIFETSYKNILDDIAEQSIILKKGAQVMITYNIDIENELVNGTRGVIENCGEDYVDITTKNGKSYRIDYINFTYEDEYVICYRTQIPIKLAWAVSAHKSQGQTIDLAICDIGHTVFSPGLAYVMLSRVRDYNSLFLTSFQKEKIYSDEESSEFLLKNEN